MIANILFLGACWLFILAVVASILLRKWHERDRRDAARTEAVMKTLLGDKSNSHIWDA